MRGPLNQVTSRQDRLAHFMFVGSESRRRHACASFKEEMPDRFFMEGISEMHLGHNVRGPRLRRLDSLCQTPFSTFLTRRFASSRSRWDVCLHNLNVPHDGNGEGLVLRAARSHAPRHSEGPSRSSRRAAKMTVVRGRPTRRR